MIPAMDVARSDLCDLAPLEKVLILMKDNDRFLLSQGEMGHNEKNNERKSAKI